MCGRYLSPEQAEIEQGFQLEGRTRHPFARRTEVRPSTTVPIVLQQGTARHLIPARWGFIPSWWARPRPPNLAFNVRCEEAPEKPMWREAWKSARCLIPAEGWYEWRDALDEQTGRVLTDPFIRKPLRKRYLVRPQHSGLIAFAGLYSNRSDQDDTEVSTTIVTRTARGSVGWLHDRMPCVLPRNAWASWLDPRLKNPVAVTRVLRTC